MLIAMSEGGVFSNPNDTDPIAPLPLLRRPPGGGPFEPGSAGPRGPQGLLQGAMRWSTLARTRCPQIRGVVIDDFWSNMARPGAVPPPPPPPPGVACPTCPTRLPHGYGYSATAGTFCCRWPAQGHCVAPAGMPAIAPCCLVPGMSKGCQGLERCGVNPHNYSCAGRGGLTLSEMDELKAALLGHPVLPSGLVDRSAPAVTPWLKLFVVTYNHDIVALAQSPLVPNKVVDGVSFWISGPEQVQLHRNLTGLVAELRALLPPVFPIFTGAYVTYSSIGYM